jgi:chromate reductase, NAD(P)H dehydrogenase (quinone)
MNPPRILAFGGSLRSGSFNHKLAAVAAAGARDAGAEVTLIRLSDYRLPLFDEDLEAAEGMPEAAIQLKALFADHSGLIIASPEYNSTITAALKNTIDWVSRSTGEGEKPLSVLRGKVAAILAASPGGSGGARSLSQLRPFLENIGISVLENQVTLPRAGEEFDESGRLVHPERESAVRELGAELARRLA